MGINTMKLLKTKTFDSGAVALYYHINTEEESGE